MDFPRTKIQPPRFRAGLVERIGLEHRIGEALQRCRLVMLIAPAGYGKTAALSRQLSRLPSHHAMAWVTVDEEDDLPRLLNCLAAALEPHDPPWRVAPDALASQAVRERGLRGTADELVNVLAAIPVARGVIALDDLHLVGDPRVFEFLGMLLGSLPEHWVLAVTSRQDPPLPLARLRVQRELAEFRQADLGFDADEIQRLGGPGLDAEGEMARSLHERTGGWAVGVCLSLDAMAGGRTIGQADVRLNRRHLFDYLADEVFRDMPQELREFLVRCCVLPELTAARCAVVSANPRAAAWLEEIERRGLFVSVLDGDEPTLRLHDLFRDFLDDRLRREHADEVHALLLRAADSEGDPVRRVGFLLRAGASTDAERVVAEVASRMQAAGDNAQVDRLIEQFPAEACERSPHLLYVRGLCAWQQFEVVTAQAMMERAAQGFDHLEQPQNALRARIFEAISLLFMGRFDEAIALSQRFDTAALARDTTVLLELFHFWRTGVQGPPCGPAHHLARMVDLLSDDAPADLWFRCLPLLYLLVGRVGVGAAMRRFVEGALRAAGDDSTPLHTAARVLDAWMLLWQGRCTRAHVAIERLRQESQWLGQPRSLRAPLMRILATYLAIRGDRKGLHAVCEAMLLDMPEALKHPDWRVNILNLIGRLSAAVDDWPAVRRTLDALEGVHDTSAVRPLQLILRTLRAHHALHEGRNGEALALLRDVAGVSAQADRMGLDASVRVCLAVAELRAGGAAQAWEALAPLVAEVGASGEVGGVLLTGAALLAELADADWAAASPAAEAAGVLRQWAELAVRLRAGEDAEPAVGDAPQLSMRELDVLALIAAGRSNKLIARELNLSPHTVKRHVARILDRLHLSSRGQAAAWYVRHRPG